MLIAEIKGKACPEIEGIEDLITSAVFGHLRLVMPNLFWPSLLGRAKNVNSPATSLAQEIQHAGIDFLSLTNLEVYFWEDCDTYGEPDIVLRFSGHEVRSVTILIEVKLNSGKSSNGERDDQLERYLRLADDRKFHAAWMTDNGVGFVVYLTRVFASDEIQESVRCSKQRDAQRRIFGLEWNDILEAAYAERSESRLLAEVAEFLNRRGLSRFRGFAYVSEETVYGSFYKSSYFSGAPMPGFEELRGSFYGH